MSGGVVSGGGVSGGVVSGGGLFPMAVAVAVAAAAALVTAVEGIPSSAHSQGSRRAVMGTPSSAHSQGSSRADRTGCRSSRSSRLTLAAKGA